MLLFCLFYIFIKDIFLYIFYFVCFMIVSYQNFLNVGFVVEYFFVKLDIWDDIVVLVVLQGFLVQLQFGIKFFVCYEVFIVKYGVVVYYGMFKIVNYLVEVVYDVVFLFVVFCYYFIVYSCFVLLLIFMLFGLFVVLD